jgi:muconolactone D-isomerase
MTMDFLVQIEIALPGDMSQARRDELAAAELAYGRELLHTGTIARIWRVPGAARNVGIWTAADATELHEAIARLPLFPWMRAEVTALARHPLGAGES